MLRITYTKQLGKTEDMLLRKLTYRIRIISHLHTSFPNCSEQEETQKIYANMKDYDALIPLTT
jgi:hypothetical protein